MSRKPVDMSPEAIDRRLRIMGGLYRFARSLKKARILGPAEPAANTELPPQPPPDPADKARND